MDKRRYIREVFRPMLPEPTHVLPKLDRLEGIRAVVFDLYGTLLISDAGDVSSDSTERRLKAMSLVSERLEGDLDSAMLLKNFDSEISRRLAEDRQQGVEFPEVEIREVWGEIVKTHLSEPLPEEVIEEIAIVYECSSNPVWEMPGARELLGQFRNSGVRLGILSNAQFYTPLVVEELFQQSLSDLGFSEDWVTFSYRLRQGKPSPAVFENSRRSAREIGLSVDEVLFVGNDMTKDVVPASSVGFKTCLFAGDSRSLRLGGRSVDDARRMADVVVTELCQIVDVLDIVE